MRTNEAALALATLGPRTLPAPRAVWSESQVQSR